MSDIEAQSRPASLLDPNGGFQQKPTLTLTPLNVSSWSAADSPEFDGPWDILDVPAKQLERPPLPEPDV
ncbi:hypothetical protein [Sphingomonas colocasiae]|uniref:Uncharacterized protein n=1 Tax=Sphingomonas colocasiae TaxID=1848973 RepID=A0ABS7PPV7_9SPHN|nr:hypothetical protein [Sphingomonas colocasiae]MBY8823360.1 hypothetical protein [Sphingomonas colocasiae]